MDFQLLLPCPIPCLMLTQLVDPPCPLCGPHQLWEEEAHAGAMVGGSLAAPTWRLAGGEQASTRAKALICWL